MCIRSYQFPSTFKMLLFSFLLKSKCRCSASDLRREAVSSLTVVSHCRVFFQSQCNVSSLTVVHFFLRMQGRRGLQREKKSQAGMLIALGATSPEAQK